MKNLFKSFNGKNMICGLCVALATCLFRYHGSFIYLGEPELPDFLEEK